MEKKKSDVSVKIDADLASWYSERAGSVRAGCTMALEGWPTIMARELRHLRGAFEVAEANLILDAANGLFLTGRLLGAHLVIEVRDHMELNGAAAHFGVDGDALMVRLGDLSPSQIAVLEWWAAWVWRSTGDENEWAARVKELTGEEP